MSIDIGATIEGTVVKLADYGAIVRLQGGKTGLIHISEIADTYVRDVKDYFKEQDKVRVKVLSMNSKGRYELSTKNVEQPIRAPIAEPRPKPVKREKEAVDLGPDVFDAPSEIRISHTFDDLMSRFMKDSQDRQIDLKRNLESKHGLKKRA